MDTKHVKEEKEEKDEKDVGKLFRKRQRKKLFINFKLKSI